MKVLNCEQTRLLEKSQVDRGSTYYELMENAGVQAGKFLISRLGGKSGQEIAIVCGKGNNGGDGFVCAKYLKSQGLTPIILLVDGEPRTPDAVRAFNGAVDSRVTVWRIWESREKVLEKIRNADCIVDAVYGIGFKGELKPEMLEVIRAINNTHSRVLSVDLPSGVGCDDGSVINGGVKADITVTFSTPKVGQLLYPAMDYCGEVVIAPVGINKWLTAESDSVMETIEEQYLKDVLPPKKKSSNKGSVGTLLAVCGSFGMAGAAVMAAQAALKSGAGLLKMTMPKSIYSICAGYIPQAVFIPMEETEKGTLSRNNLDKIISEIESCTAVMVGCGLNIDEDVEALVCEIIRHSAKPIIIDADGINVVAKHVNVLKEAKAPIVLTPHPGEMARLLGCRIADVQNDRLNVAKEFAMENNVTLVLKGANTIIASPNGKCMVNTTGNSGMSKGGSGDVLAGMLGAFVSQGADMFNSAAAAVFCHGKAGDITAQELGMLSMQPTDLISRLPFVYKEVL